MERVVRPSVKAKGRGFGSWNEEGEEGREIGEEGEEKSPPRREVTQAVKWGSRRDPKGYR